MAPQLAADEVVVVVADPRLVARHGARRLDPPHQPGVGEGTQDVVDRLVRHVAGVLAHGVDEGVGVGVRVGVHRGQHRDPRAGHPQGRASQHGREVRRGRAPRESCAVLWNRSRSGSDPGRSAGGPRSGYRARRRAAVQAPVPPQEGPADDRDDHPSRVRAGVVWAATLRAVLMWCMVPGRQRRLG